MGHVAGRVAVAQLAVAAGAAETVVGFGGHRLTSLFLFSRNGFVDGKRNVGDIFSGFCDGVQHIGAADWAFSSLNAKSARTTIDRNRYTVSRYDNTGIIHNGKLSRNVVSEFCGKYDAITSYIC